MRSMILVCLMEMEETYNIKAVLIIQYLMHSVLQSCSNFPGEESSPVWTGFTFPLFWEVEQMQQRMNEGNKHIAHPKDEGCDKLARGNEEGLCFCCPAICSEDKQRSPVSAVVNLLPLTSTSFITKYSTRQQSHICMLLNKSLGCAEALSYSCQNYRGFCTGNHV